jgi:hypothetical protein
LSIFKFCSSHLIHVMIVDIFILSLTQVIIGASCPCKLLNAATFLWPALPSITLCLSSSKFVLVYVSSTGPRLVILYIHLVLDLFKEFGICHVVDVCDLLKTLHM